MGYNILWNPSKLRTSEKSWVQKDYTFLVRELITRDKYMLWKDRLNSNGKQFHQYQKKNRTITSYDKPLTAQSAWHLVICPKAAVTYIFFLEYSSNIERNNKQSINFLHFNKITKIIIYNYKNEINKVYN